MARMEKSSFTPHPEGWFTFKIIETADGGVGQYGPTIKWTLDAGEKDEETDQELHVIHKTGTRIGPSTNAGKLLIACGLDINDIDNEWDSDLMLGKTFDGLIIHRETDKGTFANLLEMRPVKKANGNGKKGGTKEKDPFGG